ncbi:uncharacterized protein LOC119651572 [Hermetia illucens]|nr:uncharacterized protein LOC119651572 [Hermetia illucens]
MKFAVVVLCVAVAVAQAALTPILPAATLVRTPQLDSAIISSDRVGANFAYSTVEGHAYQAVAPFFRAAYPVALNYDINGIPLALPAVQQYIAAAAPLPLLSPLAPLPALQVAGIEAGKTEKPEGEGAAAAAAESKPDQPEGAKAEGDSVTVETA